MLARDGGKSSPRYPHLRRRAVTTCRVESSCSTRRTRRERRGRIWSHRTTARPAAAAAGEGDAPEVSPSPPSPPPPAAPPAAVVASASASGDIPSTGGRGRAEGGSSEGWEKYLQYFFSAVGATSAAGRGDHEEGTRPNQTSGQREKKAWGGKWPSNKYSAGCVWFERYFARRAMNSRYFNGRFILPGDLMVSVWRGQMFGGRSWPLVSGVVVAVGKEKLRSLHFRGC